MTLRTAVLASLLFVCGTTVLLNGQETRTTPLSPPAASAAPVEPAGKVARVDRRITPPAVLHTGEPEFSKEARKRKIHGTTTVALVVDAQGMPQKIHVVRSAAEDYNKPKDREAAATLDAKAIEAVQLYRFKPATRNGQPVSVAMNVEVNFQIF